MTPFIDPDMLPILEEMRAAPPTPAGSSTPALPIGAP